MKSVKVAIFFSLLGFLIMPGLGYFYLNKFRLGILFVSVEMLFLTIMTIGVMSYLLTNEYDVSSRIGFELALLHFQSVLESGDAGRLGFLENIIYLQIGMSITQLAHIVYLTKIKKIITQ